MEARNRLTNFTALVTLAAFGLLGGCDANGCHSPEPETRVVHEVALPELAPIDVPKPIESTTTHELEIGESRLYDRCHEVLQLDGEPREDLDMDDGQLWQTLVGCGADGWVEGDGTRYVVYPTAPIGPDTDQTDLRLVAWGPEGERKWSVVIERREQGKNFIANYRQSFVTVPGERHVCAGTLWEGGTTTACVNRETGKVDWSGRMSFWAGLPPVGLDDVLYVADISALTRRYPYSGVEMRGKKLDGAGGRAAFYASDGDALYFAPARADEPRLIKYSLTEMRPVWRRSLPQNPRTGFAMAVGEHNLVLALFEKDGLVAMDTETGDALWSLDVGVDRPSIAWNSSKLFVLNRVPNELNPLLAIEPRTGKVLSRAETPAGTLHIHASDERLLLRSVRAIRPILSMSEASK